MTSKTDQYRLVHLTASDDSSGEEHIHLPDLNLPTPTTSQPNGMRRKLLLKRKERDRLTSNNNLETSTRHFVPSSTSFGCSSARSALSWIAVVFGLSILVVLSFLTAKLHMRLSGLELDLIGVMDERNSLREQFQLLNTAFKEILSNQTLLSKNMSLAQGSLVLLSSRSKNLSQIVSSVSNSLKAAPELKTIPQEVDALKNNVAQFGSRLTEVETKIEKAESRALNIKENNLSEEWKESIVNATESLKVGLSNLNNRLTTVGTELTSQLQEEQKHSSKSLDVISTMQQSLLNVETRLSAVENAKQDLDGKLISSN